MTNRYTMYWYNFIQILIVIQCIDQDDITHEWSPQTKMNILWNACKACDLHINMHFYGRTRERIGSPIKLDRACKLTSQAGRGQQYYWLYQSILMLILALSILTVDIIEVYNILWIERKCRFTSIDMSSVSITIIVNTSIHTLHDQYYLQHVK